MFEHFMFGSQAQTLYHQPDERSASPTDISCLTKAPPPTSFPFQETSASPVMGELLTQMTNQKLVPDENTPTACTKTLDCPACEEADVEDCQISYISSRHGLTTIRAPFLKSSSSAAPQAPTSCKRLQRQVNTKLQSCTNHVKHITSLVEDMVATNPQCTVHTASTVSAASPLLSDTSIVPNSSPSCCCSSSSSSSSAPTAPPQSNDPPEDEGFCELDEADAICLLIDQQERADQDGDAMSLRSASAPSRIRKLGVIKYKSTRCENQPGSKSDAGMNTYMRRKASAPKVRRPPRMIRRDIDRRKTKGKEKEV